MIDNKLGIIKRKIEEGIVLINNDNLADLSKLLSSPETLLLVQNESRYTTIYKFIQSALLEKTENRENLYTILKDDELLKQNDFLIKTILYRLYSDFITEDVLCNLEQCFESGVSVYTFLIYSRYLNLGSETVIIRLSDILKELGENEKSLLLLNSAHKMYSENTDILLKLVESYFYFGMAEEANKLITEYKKKVGVETSEDN